MSLNFPRYEPVFTAGNLLQAVVIIAGGFTALITIMTAISDLRGEDKVHQTQIEEIRSAISDLPDLRTLIIQTQSLAAQQREAITAAREDRLMIMRQLNELSRKSDGR